MTRPWQTRLAVAAVVAVAWFLDAGVSAFALLVSSGRGLSVAHHSTTAATRLCAANSSSDSAECESLSQVPDEKWDLELFR